jgi:hypothetical protein
MRILILALAILCATLSNGVMAQAGRIYTAPDPASQGELKGTVNLGLTHAIAMERDRAHVYLAALSDGGKTFDFQHLPTGKYDLVLVTQDGQLFEGLNLGEEPSTLTTTQKSKLDRRIALADSFFQSYLAHRVGVDGEIALAFVERFTGGGVLKQSGEKLGAIVRRLEVVELHQATDDWQMTNTRHLYRETEKMRENTKFLKDVFTSELSGIRVVDAPKNLGSLTLTVSEPSPSK